MKIKTKSYKLTFLEHVLGTVPKNKEIYTSYIATKHEERKKEKLPKEKLEEELESIKETERKGWTGFMSDDKGIFVYDYWIRGFLKSAGQALKDQHLSMKNFKSKIDQLVFVFPRKLYFKNDKGKTYKNPCGEIERPLRAMTMQGPRVTLAKSDYIESGATLEFDLKMIENSRELSFKTIEDYLDFGELQGLGQFRNGSYGRFTWKQR